MKFHLIVCAFFLSLLTSQCLAADEPKADQKPPAAETKTASPPTKEELEKKFEQMLTNVTLKGHFTSDRNDTAPTKEDEYDIESVTKLQGEFWLFKTRIKYGDHDLTVPLPLRVVWAGDTPVITLDDMDVPGFGKFTARVMFFDGRYAGMWDGHGHGGLLIGKIMKQEAKDNKK